jgi:hypothetical protein
MAEMEFELSIKLHKLNIDCRAQEIEMLIFQIQF